MTNAEWDELQSLRAIVRPEKDAWRVSPREAYLLDKERKMINEQEAHAGNLIYDNEDIDCGDID